MILYPILIVLLITTVIVVYNFNTAPVLKIPSGSKSSNPLVSVLIPARNEEANIKKCLAGIVDQSYKNIEVIILDDESSDNTFLYASEVAAIDKRVKVIKGNPLPANFTGKNWACHQLSLLATGSYLLFIDADVEPGRDSIDAALSEMEKNDLKLLSVFPSQKLSSLGEWLMVPLMNWLLLTFLPLLFIHSSASPSFAAANGQFMLFSREMYRKTGGHSTVKDAITEDIEFIRLFKRMKFKVKTYLGGDLVYCRMYSNFTSTLSGFSKNFYPGFNTNPFTFILLIVFFTISFNAPLFLVFTNNIFLPLVILILLQRVLISKISRQNSLLNILLHPVQMIMVLVLGINSLILSSRRERIWKGRTL